MTYDYFNTSNLAFGSKLTKAFVNLTKLSDDVNKKSQAVIDRWAAYQAMLYKNYLVPRPTEADNPVRTSEMYDLMRGNLFFIEQLVFHNNRLYVKMHKFTSSTNRMTKLTGNTTLKRGYAFIQDAISNNNTARTINFVSDMSEGRGNLLFEFRVDKEGVVNLIDDVSPMALIPNDMTQYNDVAQYEVIKNFPVEDYYTRFDGLNTRGRDGWTHYGTSKSFTYTPTEDMCIIAVGSQGAIRVKRGSKIIFQGMGYLKGANSILYVKAGDTYTFDNCLTILRVKYKQNMPEYRE